MNNHTSVIIIPKTLILSIFYLILAFPCSGRDVLVIDPGHPSENGIGAQTREGVREVDINWAVSSRLIELIASDTRVECLLTKRSASETVTNRRRAELANAASASLLLRIHCDSGKGHGMTLYYPAAPGKLREHHGPPDNVCSASAILANRLKQALGQRLGERYPVNLRTDRQTAIGARQGALTGSIFSRVPVVTIELGYLDNPRDVEIILSTSTREFLVESIAASVLRTLFPDEASSPGGL
ncbi:MAG TPA: N-acetylmuramoyl-L-alanine amidase [Candidatus Ozemobacteraceae bacterium]|nr:N-acetylmuramoyl-L-alanine amidase [Candidatus Ozemobacteraceae bacterium]